MANDAVAGNGLDLASLDGIDPGQSAPSAGGLATVVDEVLEAFLATEIDALNEVDPAVGQFARTAADCVLAGGKRLRPTFAYWGWRGVVGRHERLGPVLPALAALELLHTFALVHDDVMDRSATRRGRPTVHRIFAAEHEAAGRVGDPARFGEAGAVLVGDICLVWADRLLARVAVSPATLAEVRRCYDQMRVEAVAGQYLDVLGEADAGHWSVERALRVARYKTASYTVHRPLLFGAALAGLRRDGPVIAAYHRYGTAVGEAFQLCDDLLGVYGDPLTTGKPAGDDLSSGKPTTLLMLARQLATDSQRAELDRARSAADEAAVLRLAEVVSQTGAVERVQKMIAERVDEALSAIDAAPLDDTARTALVGLAVAATRRRA